MEQSLTLAGVGRFTTLWIIFFAHILRITFVFALTVSRDFRVLAL